MSTHPERHEATDSDGANGVDTGNDATRQYHRILAILPRAYREQHGQEMLTTLLDAAADTGRRRASPGEWLSVLGLSLRLRAGAPGAGPRAQSAGETLRLITLLGLILQVGTPRQPQTWQAGPAVGALLRLSGIPTWGQTTIVISSLLCPALAIAALLRGRRRLGLALLAVSTALCLATFPQVFTVGPDTWWQNGCALLALCIVPLCAGLLGFHRDAPRIQHPRWWLAAMALAGLSLLLAGFTLTLFDDSYLSYRLFNPLWRPSCLLEAGCVCVLTVIVLRHARRSIAGPLALAVAVSPLLLVLPCLAITLSSGTYSPLLNALNITALLGPYTWIGLYVLAAEALLVITLIPAAHRLRSTMATSNTPA